MGTGRGRGPQAGTLGVQGRVYAVTPQAESADQPVIQGTFLLSCLWARVLFDSGASHSFIAASVVIELGLEVETLEEPLYVSSPLGISVTPHSRGSVDYPSTRGIQVDVGLPDTTFRKSGRASLVRRALPTYSTCIYLHIQYLSRNGLLGS